MDLQQISEYAAIIAACGVVAGVVEAFVFLVKLRLLSHVNWIRAALERQRAVMERYERDRPVCPTCKR